MNNFLDQKFFERPVMEVAEDLIGQFLVKNGKRLTIQEIEAYDGEKDLACHASRGRTARTQVLYGPAGHFYVYLCYGVHWLMNIVTGPENYPAAILIRGAGDIFGPGRLTKELGINGSFHGKPALPENGLWFEPAECRPHKKLIQRTPRIGIDYAGPVWSKKPYRLVLPT